MRLFTSLFSRLVMPRPSQMQAQTPIEMLKSRIEDLKAEQRSSCFPQQIKEDKIKGLQVLKNHLTQGGAFPQSDAELDQLLSEENSLLNNQTSPLNAARLRSGWFSTRTSDLLDTLQLPGKLNQVLFRVARSACCVPTDIQNALDAGANVCGVNSNGETALHLALKYGTLMMNANMLIETMAMTEEGKNALILADNNGKTALMLAFEMGDLYFADKLLNIYNSFDEGRNAIIAADIDGKTALAWGIQCSSWPAQYEWKVLRADDPLYKLLKIMCVSDDGKKMLVAADNDDFTPLKRALNTTGKQYYCNLLIKFIDNEVINAPAPIFNNTDLMTILMDDYNAAIHLSNEEIAYKILQIMNKCHEGRKLLVAPNSAGHTPLYHALANGQLNIVDSLLQLISSELITAPAPLFNKTDLMKILLNNYGTAIHLKNENVAYEIAKILVGVDEGIKALLAVDRFGLSGIGKAISEGYDRIVSMILKIMIETGVGKEALEARCYHQNIPHIRSTLLIDALKELASNITTAAEWGKVINEKPYLNIIDMLISVMSPEAINAFDTYRDTALSVALGKFKRNKNLQDIVYLLFKKMILTNDGIKALKVANKSGETPYSLANKNGYNDLAIAIMKKISIFDLLNSTQSVEEAIKKANEGDYRLIWWLIEYYQQQNVNFDLMACYSSIASESPYFAKANQILLDYTLSFKESSVSENTGSLDEEDTRYKNLEKLFTYAYNSIPYNKDNKELAKSYYNELMGRSMDNKITYDLSGDTKTLIANAEEYRKK